MFKIEEPQTVQEALNQIEAFNTFIEGAEENGFFADQLITVEITVTDKTELKAVADLYKANYFEPCSGLAYYWAFITIGRVKAQLRTKELKFQLVED